MNNGYSLAKVWNIIKTHFPEYGILTMEWGFVITNDKLNSIGNGVQFYILVYENSPIMLITDNGLYKEVKKSNVQVNDADKVDLANYGVSIRNDALTSIVSRDDENIIVNGFRKYSKLMNELFIVKE